MVDGKEIHRCVCVGEPGLVRDARVALWRLGTKGAEPMMRLRAIAIVVAALLTVTLVGGCSGSSSKPSLAEQDRMVELSNQLEAVHSQYEATQRRLAQARRAVSRVRSAAVLETRTVTRPAPTTSTTTPPSNPLNPVQRVKPAPQSPVLTIDNLCRADPAACDVGPQRKAQRELERRRRRALYYLNLSCPSDRA